ncbi:hypothetical protein N9Q59_00940 [Gammaproteobacteria bacterium]|nr:hypothetical protein [Gammaproteobacteria bacterium]MDA9184499.1 hypothetical protein [Gammaproteobacteria bacterium]MDA9311213.1 hypothetical protein [Gammaproteobacteria bacterium]MDA9578880.1 hypothetical protein [Gammaproteobacteria bacterium]MDC1358031.1 hypothetical protein [Gammaproteobacteria bacterium]
MAERTGDDTNFAVESLLQVAIMAMGYVYTLPEQKHGRQEPRISETNEALSRAQYSQTRQ